MQTTRSSITTRRYLVPFALVTLLFFLWGFARAILDVLNKHFQNALSISLSQSALIQVTTYLGYFLMAIPAGWFINRRGYRLGVVFGLLLFGAGALLFIPSAEAGTFGAYLSALFVIGCGLVFLETAANPYVTELGDPSTASSRLNLSQSFNGLGSLSATFFVGQFLFSSAPSTRNVVLPYAVLGGVVLIIALIFSRVDLPEVPHQRNQDDTRPGTRIVKLFRHHPLFVFGLFSLLAYEVAEISINSYFIPFVTGRGWMSDQHASLLLTLSLALFMMGRLGGSWLMQRVRPEQLLLWCGSGAVACLVLLLADVGILSLVALVSLYLLEAIMFPTIFSLSLRGVGSLTKSASSLLMMTPIGGCGFLLMGWIHDGTGSWTLPFIIPLIGFVVIVLFASELTRKGEASSMLQ